MTDMELFDAWCRSDRQAGNALFERHFDSLYKFFRNKIADGIDDLVQQTFLGCVRGRDVFRRESSFRTYMFSVAKHILYQELERRRKSADRLDFHVTSVHDLGPGVSTAYARHREQRLLLDGLRMLPVEFQIAVELYYFEGMRGPEIAEVLGIPEATVRSRLDRGVKQLRQQVERLARSPELRRSAGERFDFWAQSLRQAVGPTEVPSA